MADKKYEVSILSVNLSENSVLIKFKGGSEKLFPVVSPARIEYAKVGNAEISIQNDEIVYLRMKTGFSKGGYPKKNESQANIRTSEMPLEQSSSVQKLIVRQHTQKVATDIINNYLGKKYTPDEPLFSNVQDYLTKLLEIAHILEEDVFRDSE